MAAIRTKGLAAREELMTAPATTQPRLLSGQTARLKTFPSNEFGLLMGCSMCDLLKAAETVVDEYKGVPSPHFHSLLVKLEEAIAATKARSEWVPVAERLPVVPEGAVFVKLWVFTRHGQIKKMSWHCDFDIDMAHSFTHWMYR